MQLPRRPLVRVALLSIAVIVLGNIYNGIVMLVWSFAVPTIISVFSRNYPSRQIQGSLFLDEGQCRAAFPELNKEIDDGVARGPFHLKKAPADYMGLVQARIKDGKVRFTVVELFHC